MKNAFRKIISLLSKSNSIYLFSKKIVDYHRNENNCEIKTNGEYNFIYSNREKFDIVFDVGANIGEWTNLVSKIAPNSKIYSFEPSYETFNELKSNCISENIFPINIGLGEKDEEKTFYIEQDSTLNSVFYRETDPTKDSATKITAHFETFDSFCDRNKIDRVAFLKIDTEGNELAVLNGAKKYISEGKVEMIQFEYGGTYTNAKIYLLDIFNFFINKPYIIHKVMPTGLIKLERYDRSLENLQYSNYVAIKKNDNN